jgi:hypothetical protein
MRGTPTPTLTRPISQHRTNELARGKEGTRKSRAEVTSSQNPIHLPFAPIEIHYRRRPKTTLDNDITYYHPHNRTKPLDNNNPITYTHSQNVQKSPRHRARAGQPPRIRRNPPDHQHLRPRRRALNPAGRQQEIVPREGPGPLQQPAQCRQHGQGRQRRRHRPRRRPGLRRCHEAADQGRPQRQHHLGRQVQDFRLWLCHCQQQLPDRARPWHDARAGRPYQEHRDCKGALLASCQAYVYLYH